MQQGRCMEPQVEVEILELSFPRGTVNPIRLKARAFELVTVGNLR